MQIGGSMSSFMASSNLLRFMDPKRVLVLDMLLLVRFAFASFCCSYAIILLFLLMPPLFMVTKH
jgi:hypothetical protein